MKCQYSQRVFQGVLRLKHNIMIIFVIVKLQTPRTVYSKTLLNIKISCNKEKMITKSVNLSFLRPVIPQKTLNKILGLLQCVCDQPGLLETEEHLTDACPASRAEFENRRSIQIVTKSRNASFKQYLFLINKLSILTSFQLPLVLEIIVDFMANG